MVDYTRFGPTAMLVKPYTDIWMLVWEETGFFRFKQHVPRFNLTGPQWYNLLQKMTFETEKGVTLWVDKMAFVGWNAG